MAMDIISFLRADPEDAPAWLETVDQQTTFDLAMILSGRTVFYPGAEFDGQPLRLFGKARAAHTFVFADLSYDQDTVVERIHNHIRGYHPLGIDLQHWRDLPLPPVPRVDYADRRRDVPLPSLVVWSVLERSDGMGEDHGPRRISVLAIAGEGIAVYRSLYGGRVPPYAVVVQDHGFGGNPDRFGAGGQLAGSGIMPQYLLVGEPTKPWPGYAACPIQPDRGGSPNYAPRVRHLFARVATPSRP